MRLPFVILVLALLCASSSHAQTNPLWREEKVKNYLPHMTAPEVRDLLSRTDMVLIPVPSLEQHGLHGPLGSDFYAGIEQAKLIAQRTEVLVAPILMVVQAGYHMGFPGTLTLSAETIQRVYFEAAQSLIHHGFRKFLFMNSHTGNQHITLRGGPDQPGSHYRSRPSERGTSRGRLSEVHREMEAAAASGGSSVTRI